jgi:hypothetical protein
MKFFLINKNLFLSLCLFCIFLCSISTLKITNSEKYSEISEFVNSSNIEKSKKTNFQKHNNHKKHIKLKLKSENRKRTDSLKENNEVIAKTNAIQYASWFIFVPLVILIFVVTILSIIGFLMLILNSKSTHSHNHNPILQPTRIRNNLSNTEIIEILRFKQSLAKTKKQQNGSRLEPEPEGFICKN